MNNESNGDRPVILVVDDTPDNLALMSALLRDSYKVKVANGGERRRCASPARFPVPT